MRSFPRRPGEGSPSPGRRPRTGAREVGSPWTPPAARRGSASLGATPLKRSPSSAGRGAGGAGGRGSSSCGRRPGASGESSRRARTSARPRPEWDFTDSDMARYQLSPAEQQRRRQLRISKHREAAALDMQRKLRSMEENIAPFVRGPDSSPLQPQFAHASPVFASRVPTGRLPGCTAAAAAAAAAAAHRPGLAAAGRRADAGAVADGAAVAAAAAAAAAASAGGASAVGGGASDEDPLEQVLEAEIASFFKAGAAPAAFEPVPRVLFRESHQSGDVSPVPADFPCSSQEARELERQLAWWRQQEETLFGSERSLTTTEQVNRIAGEEQMTFGVVQMVDDHQEQPLPAAPRQEVEACADGDTSFFTEATYETARSHPAVVVDDLIACTDDRDPCACLDEAQSCFDELTADSKWLELTRPSEVRSTLTFSPEPLGQASISDIAIGDAAVEQVDCPGALSELVRLQAAALVGVGFDRDTEASIKASQPSMRQSMELPPACDVQACSNSSQARSGTGWSAGTSFQVVNVLPDLRSPSSLLVSQSSAQNMRSSRDVENAKDAVGRPCRTDGTCFAPHPRQPEKSIDVYPAKSESGSSKAFASRVGAGALVQAGAFSPSKPVGVGASLPDEGSLSFIEEKKQVDIAQMEQSAMQRPAPRETLLCAVSKQQLDGRDECHASKSNERVPKRAILFDAAAALDVARAWAADLVAADQSDKRTFEAKQPSSYVRVDDAQAQQFRECSVGDRQYEGHGNGSALTLRDLTSAKAYDRRPIDPDGDSVGAMHPAAHAGIPGSQRVCSISSEDASLTLEARGFSDLFNM
eukprot:TRINITY_DN14070_c0_g3_i1.p1 TRINITY_DN14070_c0_g3~~TRINITY_DN14070_c0_g3_i1.p1  ORF type:complete len:816 (+),score=145.80 TRINITY_DN14070_c0_g3_i1:66-2513(+)